MRISIYSRLSSPISAVSATFAARTEFFDGYGGVPSASGKRRQKLVLLLGLYTAILLFIVPRLSLWLDEILGLIGVRYAHLNSLIDYLSNMPGGCRSPTQRNGPW